MKQNIKKAIVLSGGLATRLYPLTKSISKQLLPLYKKPVIAYPLQTLKSMGYVDILIINANEAQQNQFKNLLGNGDKFGLNLSYIIQDKPRGLADAFLVGSDFIKNADEICLILGDNVIIGNTALEATPNTIFTYKVDEPSSYGVVLKNEDNHIVKLVEKPTEFVSNDAVIGLYIFSGIVKDIAKNITPSSRGELEIVDVIKEINKIEKIKVQELDGFWFDVGDFDSLLDCGNLIRTIDKRSNHDIGLVGL